MVLVGVVATLVLVCTSRGSGVCSRWGQLQAATAWHDTKACVQGLYASWEILRFHWRLLLGSKRVVGGPPLGEVALEACGVHSRGLQGLLGGVEGMVGSAGTLTCVIIRGVYIFSYDLNLGLVERVVSVRGRTQNTATSALLSRLFAVADISRYFLDVYIVLLAILLRYPVLYHLINLHVADFARVCAMTLIIHYRLHDMVLLVQQPDVPVRCQSGLAVDHIEQVALILAHLAVIVGDSALANGRRDERVSRRRPVTEARETLTILGHTFLVVVVVVIGRAHVELCIVGHAHVRDALLS